jgi:hypothetical protein
LAKLFWSSKAQQRPHSDARGYTRKNDKDGFDDADHE